MKLSEKIAQYNAFRKLCLVNAESAIKSAELLINKDANHIVYHLLVLAIEEIGKIFVGFNEFVKEEQWDKENPNFGFDDHTKKLFWAIWGPTIGNEIITKQQWEENQRMASTLHQRRLNSLYTGINDIISASNKISNADVTQLLSFAKARSNLAKIEGEGDPNLANNPEMEWMAAANRDPLKRSFIFGKESQEKLVEFGNPRLWIAWLKEYYEKENQALSQLIEKEITRDTWGDEKMDSPKWKIKIKLITPSHSIRQKVLDEFNKIHNTIFTLSKGGDTHTLLVEFSFPASISVTALWQHGWLLSKFYVGALNAASNGFFYWNAIIDTEKYYETIRDLENNQWLSAKLESGLKLNWAERKMALNINHLHLAKMIFDYLVQIREQSLFISVNKYLQALALLSKSDIHSRFEYQIFGLFFSSLKDAVAATYKGGSYTSVSEILYPQLEKMIKTKTEFERIIALGYELQQENPVLKQPITLAEVILIKQYCGFYLMTLAARKLHNDDSLALVIQEGEI
jgi:AbiV family abortive infection protein